MGIQGGFFGFIFVLIGCLYIYRVFKSIRTGKISGSNGGGSGGGKAKIHDRKNDPIGFWFYFCLDVFWVLICTFASISVFK